MCCLYSIFLRAEAMWAGPSAAMVAPLKRNVTPVGWRFHVNYMMSYHIECFLFASNQQFLSVPGKLTNDTLLLVVTSESLHFHCTNLRSLLQTLTSLASCRCYVWWFVGPLCCMKYQHCALNNPFPYVRMFRNKISWFDEWRC